jgi:hypothetical protein
MNEDDILELHQLITDWAMKKEYTSAQMCGFLSTCLIGTMAMKGYDEDFVDSTLELMKKRYLKHPLRKK